MTLEAQQCDGASSCPRTVTIPKLDLSARIDGRLDEPAWSQASTLTGFHQYEPVDGRSATDPTEVRIWYDPHALYLGIIATTNQPDAVRATHSGRDKVDHDDRVLIYLDTFYDQRRAFIFGVNPLGVQFDGTLSISGDEDYAPDFYFESYGRRTATGYEVEVRIPFASLRYPVAPVQQWGFQVRRRHAARGVTDTWTDVRRSGNSFLAQSGVLQGLRGLPSGIVTEAQPVMTAGAVSARDAVTGDFAGGALTSRIGINLKAAMTRFALDATFNPDFSQIESDAAQVTVNERFAISLPEKRPFFLEGNNLFQVSNDLIYSRRIVAPVVGLKFTGKFGRTTLASLAALDDTAGTHAFANALRVTRDFGTSSAAGLTITNRVEDERDNHLVAVDGRLVWSKMYLLKAQFGLAWTKAAGVGLDPMPLWEILTDRTGRAWGFYYRFRGIAEDFHADLGFVPRPGVIDASAFNRFSWYGAPGAWLERTNLNVTMDRLWTYAHAFRHQPDEGSDRVEVSLQARGGWTLSGSLSSAFVVPDPAQYAGYTVNESGTERPYDLPSKLSAMTGISVSLTTPIYPRMQGNVTIRRNQVALFAEGSEGRETSITGSLIYRPTAGVQLTADMHWLRLTRARDGSPFARSVIPRLKAEYRLNRSVSLRMVGEYQMEKYAALLDPQSGDSILIDGEPVPVTERRYLQMDWLSAYEPKPGTVVFLGYGRSYTPLGGELGTPAARLTHASERLFMKIAYHFRF